MQIEANVEETIGDKLFRRNRYGEYNNEQNTIGVIHSPYKEPRNMPIEGIFKQETEALVELKEEFSNGLKDIKSL